MKVSDSSESSIPTQDIVSRQYRVGAIEHIVLFRFKPDVSDVLRSEVESQVLALADSEHRDGSGRYIVSITLGLQNSPEGLGHGFEFGFRVRFASEGDRNYYVGQPFVTSPALFDLRHDAFKHFVGPLLHPGPSGVLVFDYRVSGSRENP